MGTRIPSHQLSNGLYVSGRPEQLKERQPTMGSRAVPYTGGDVKKSGELGKMFDIAVDPNPLNGPPSSRPSRPSSSSQHNSGSVRSGPNSGPLGTKSSGSGPIPKKSSGPLPLQPTGLITSGPLGSSVGRRSGQLEPPASLGKAVYGSAVTGLNEEVRLRFKVSKPVMWVLLVVVVMGLVVGAFLTVAVKKLVILVAVAAILAPLVVVILWNCAWKKRGLIGFLRRYSDAELRGAIDGQYVKVTGVVTCGSIPLESSFQRVPRCVYVSTELYEYRGWGGKSANPKHRFFSWGCRHSEKYVADFYISDFQSGVRAVVKAGYGAKVTPFIKPATVVDITKENRELSPSFLRWLADRSLSSDDRVMCLKEGYIKEGSTVSVMGVVRRQDNVLMIVPPAEPVSTGCQWARCLLPTYIEGLILTCDESQDDADVIPV
ncbi:hypothetical protein F0562_018817 [Nyssa sinensis]|uniref:Ubiquitin-specific protease family C19-related protein n=1 Tax=Nyssa sinensis TaxID=561372 RepID=A0A5J4ZCV4_9ASTE|nr:hypothetical protein F0562_018817 [Nyssa sinensis]